MAQQVTLAIMTALGLSTLIMLSLAYKHRSTTSDKRTVYRLALLLGAEHFTKRGRKYQTIARVLAALTIIAIMFL